MNKQNVLKNNNIFKRTSIYETLYMWSKLLIKELYIITFILLEYLK